MNKKMLKKAAVLVMAFAAMVAAENLTGRDVVQKVHDRPECSSVTLTM